MVKTAKNKWVLEQSRKQTHCYNYLCTFRGAQASIWTLPFHPTFQWPVPGLGWECEIWRWLLLESILKYLKSKNFSLNGRSYFIWRDPCRWTHWLYGRTAQEAQRLHQWHFWLSSGLREKDLTPRSLRGLHASLYSLPSNLIKKRDIYLFL